MRLQGFEAFVCAHVADLLLDKFKTCKGSLAFDFIYFLVFAAVDLFACAEFEVDAVAVFYEFSKFFG